jgi:hypothetical protein
MRLFRPKPVDEFKRKCSECGYSWYVTAQERKIPPPSSPQIPDLMHSVGARVQLGLGKRRAVAAVRELEHLEAQRWKFEARRARAAQINSCAQCGSLTFTERRVTRPS